MESATELNMKMQHQLLKLLQSLLRKQLLRLKLLPIWLIKRGVHLVIGGMVQLSMMFLLKFRRINLRSRSMQPKGALMTALHITRPMSL